MSPNELTATEMLAAIRAGTLTAEALMEACLAAVAEREPVVGAFAYLDPALARAQARAADRGPVKGPLQGLPLAAKDIIDTADMPTECNSTIWDGYRAGRDAACVAQVRAAGAVIMGKSVTTEFATGHPGRTTNPHNPGHTPGGSSSGSAAGVAAGFFPLAFGTQTGGSVIRPGAYNGVYAMKPSFNLVGREGVKPLSDTFDTLGWYGRSVEDLALLLPVLSPLRMADSAPESLRIAVCHTPEADKAAAPARIALKDAARLLSAAGHAIEELELGPDYAALYDVHTLISEVDASRSFRRESIWHEALLNPRLRENVRKGRTVGAAEEREARRRIALAQIDFDGVMERFDAVLTYPAPGEAPKGLASTGDAVFNRLWTLLGVPCIQIPFTTGPAGLPLGVQLVGRRYDDGALLATAAKAVPALVEARATLAA